ncbi:50S ribosomal protein L11 methyltransferase [Salsuginibacillus kocurii]|uniref:50S ribosomal protein L11 methyltransferase n=1 Tax=Salsuginibacillus kocurii TaxID=427078 RepID=UPI00036044FE|nr:50S ribosomal protein L11 methyltransferase [Salsuginibacillus kocurii]
MKWTEFRVHTKNEAVEAISNILHEAGASGVVIEDATDLTRGFDSPEGEWVELSPEDYPEEGVVVKSYFPESSHLQETVEGVQHSINELSHYGLDIGANVVTLSEVEEEDWAHAWKKYYKPVKVTSELTIAPSWENYTPFSSEEKVIELDPGMAFGTGTHPSTLLSLTALEETVQKQDEVIDVGTGSGILSIAAALYGAKNVRAFDVDEVAVRTAKENIELNGVSSTVLVEHKNLLADMKAQADVVVANILAEVILRLVNDARANLKTGGSFITSGIIRRKKEEVREALTAGGFEIVEVLEMEDWVTFIAKAV